MFWRMNRENYTPLDRLSCATPTLFAIHLLLGFFTAYLFDLPLYFMDRRARLVIWALTNCTYLAVWGAVYLVFLAHSVVRRYPIFPLAWFSAVFLALISHVPIRILVASIQQCGGWDAFVALVSAPFDDLSWMYQQ